MRGMARYAERGTIVFIRELRKNVSAFNGMNLVNLIHEKGMRLMLHT